MGCNASSPERVHSANISSSTNSSMLTIKVENYDTGVMYSDVTHSRPVTAAMAADSAVTADGVGAASENLRKAMEQGKQDIRMTQEKLSSSLNTPIVDKEIKVIENGSWLNEKKDVNMRYSLLPPIPDGKKVKSQAMAFTID